jgi:hypothetical protein
MAFILIYIWLYLENEEEVEVEEEKASPGAFATSLCFKNLFHLLDALGDRS